VREEDLNRRLARLLRQEGLDAESEYSILGSNSKRFDVFIDLPDGLSVAVECKKGWSDTAKKQAVDAAKGRLPFVSSGIAVCFPDRVMHEADLDKDTEIFARTLSADWVKTTPKGLADLVRRVSQELGDPDQAANYLKEHLELAVSYLSQQQCFDLATSLSLPPSTQRNWEQQAGVRALLVVAAAAMFHARLDSYLPTMEPRVDARTGTPFADSWPPRKLQDCLSGADPIQDLTDAWGLTLAVDYKPVFETAIAAIQAPSRNSNLTEAVRLVAQAALSLAGGLAALRHDLLGRIFHKVLDTARYDGSFYTSTAAATLLAGLAIAPNLPETAGGGLQDLRIIDPACGTGTLLMAAAERLQDIHPGGRSPLLGKELLENILHGYDINLSATHMAATTLGLVSPEVKFNKINIHECFFGIKNGRAHVGSLEFYGGQASLNAWPISKQIDAQEVQQVHTPGKHDLVIMNPPFTRGDIRYDQFSESEEKLMKNREKKLFGKSPARLSHSGGLFLLLGEKLSDPRNGIMAIIYPAASAGAPSANPIWKHLLDYFWVEVVVASHDPKRIFFSENTNISEILVVLRRHQDISDWQPPDAEFIRLSNNPVQPSQTIAIYEAFHSGTLPNRGGAGVYVNGLKSKFNRVIGFQLNFFPTSWSKPLKTGLLTSKL